MRSFGTKRTVATRPLILSSITHRFHAFLGGPQTAGHVLPHYTIDLLETLHTPRDINGIFTVF
ncbi:hypothetical protein E2C01_029144 [Portunus trituberculatus]|uniref:Uncharacterized protein n=1 Tax=Portunus trituberculatus TaxID=210409 RepID=A0A5B7ES15_PORTR|nr:hypothetical protein [Portunus trituberculatus]